MRAGYPVPAEEAQVELRCGNSRFIAAAGPAASVADARAFVARRRQQYPDAAHHVFAFAVGYGSTVTCGMSDDGEPSGTAGRPCLAVVQGAGLGDVVLVVTRYFGGTKLGTGGLVRAYTAAAQSALAAVARRPKVDVRVVGLALPYPRYAQGRAAIRSCDAEVESEEFGEDVRLRVRVQATRLDELRQALADATAGQARWSDPEG